MKNKFLITLLIIFGVFSFVFSYIRAIEISPEELDALLEQNLGAFRVCTVQQGCTGTSTPPTLGQLLLGQTDGSYDLVATSTLFTAGVDTLPTGTSGQTLTYQGEWTSTSTLTILDNGMVGIGTSSPDSLFHVWGVGNGAVIKIEDQSGGIPALQLRSGDNRYNLELGREGADTFGIRDGTAGLTRFLIDTNGSVAIGTSTPYQLPDANLKLIVDGEISSPHGESSERFGKNSSADGKESVALGNGASADALRSVSIGYLANCDVPNSVCIGWGSRSLDETAVALGRSAQADGDSALAIGFNTAATNLRSTAIGTDAESHGFEATAIGAVSYTGANALNSLVIGNDGIVIGRESFGFGSTVKVYTDNTAVFGSENFPIDNTFFGKGATSTAPTAYTINGTAGSGTDIAGGSINYSAGIGTGAGIGGDHIFNTAMPGASGSSLNTLVEAMRITDDGNVGIGTTTPDTLLTIGTGTGLQINGTLSNHPKIVFSNDGTAVGRLNVALQNNAGFAGAVENDFIIKNIMPNALRLGTNNAEVITIISSGNVGIDDTDPDFDFELVGDFAVSATAGGDGDRFIVQSGGNVGIGTTSPFAKLAVENTGVGNSFIVADEANDISPFVIDANGFVAIGTSTPGVFPLHVESNSSAGIKVFAETGFSASFNIEGDGGASHFAYQALVGNNFRIYDLINSQERFTILDNGNVGIASSSPQSKLAVEGNITGNFYYGEMYAYINATSTPINTQSVYTKVGGDGSSDQMIIESGLLNGFTHANGTTTVMYGGTYRIIATVSGTGENNKEYHYAVGKNNVRQTKCHTPRKLSATDIGSWSVSCFLDLDVGDDITLMIENTTDTTDVTVSDFNLNIVYIGLPQ